MDFGRGVTYIRRDPAWLGKVIIGSLISLVPILQFAAVGYAMAALRNVYTGRETPLPEWGENFGDHFVRGLLAAVIQLIYGLPMVVPVCAVFGLSWFTTLASRSEDVSAAPVAMLCLMPFLFIAGLLLSVLGMVATARYAVSGDFGQALRFGEVIAEFRRGLGAWLGMLLTLVLGGFALVLGITITCGLGILLSFYFTLVQYHWMAQAYRQSSGPVEAPGYNY